jgi:hypothetical protein
MSQLTDAGQVQQPDHFLIGHSPSPINDNLEIEPTQSVRMSVLNHEIALIDEVQRLKLCVCFVIERRTIGVLQFLQKRKSKKQPAKIQVTRTLIPSRLATLSPKTTSPLVRTQTAQFACKKWRKGQI